MKALWKIILLVCGFTCIAQNNSKCLYVNAESGLNVRKEPQLSSPILQSLPYGTAVEIIEQSGVFATVSDNDQSINGEWFKINAINPQTHNIYPVQGYVHSAFLTSHLEKIPDHAVHNFIDIFYFENGVSEEIKGISEFGNYDTGYCSSLYPYVPECKEILEKYILIEKIESDNLPTAINHPFQIDSSWQPLKMPLDKKEATEHMEQYYLPINDGMDSILVQDNISEWEYKREYVGSVPALDFHIVTDFPELEEVAIISMTTGKYLFTTSGVPEFNPVGTVAVSTIHNPFEDLAHLEVKSLKSDKSITVFFSSFYFDSKIDWISETSFLTSIKPLDGVYSKNNVQPQFIKITLKDF